MIRVCNINAKISNQTIIKMLHLLDTTLAQKMNVKNCIE